MATYAEKLKDPRWQKKRLLIMQRDGWKCAQCGDSKNTLHVHHYKYSGEPWEAEDRYLITLCKECHILMESAAESIGKQNELKLSLNALGIDDISLFVIMNAVFQRVKMPDKIQEAELMRRVVALVCKKLTEHFNPPKNG